MVKQPIDIPRLAIAGALIAFWAGAVWGLMKLIDRVI